MLGAPGLQQASSSVAKILPASIFPLAQRGRQDGVEENASKALLAGVPFVKSTDSLFHATEAFSTASQSKQ